MSYFEQFKLTLDLNTDRHEIFRTMTEHFSELSKTVGLDIKPFRGDKPEYFQKMPVGLQDSVIMSFLKSVEVIQEMAALNEPFGSGQKFLWRMLRNMNLRPTRDLFSILEDDDVIEIYQLPQCVQIFRNLKFYKVCSYSLDEILCRPFWDLFQRDEKVTKAIMERVTFATSQIEPRTVEYNIEPYILTEIDSSRCLISEVENKFLSPLFDENHNIVAMVNVMSGRVISQNKDAVDSSDLFIKRRDILEKGL